MNQKICEKKLRVLYQFSSIIGKALNLDKTLTEMLTVMAQSLEMKRATLVLRGDEPDTLAIRASFGLTPKEMERGIYKVDEGVTGRIYVTGKPYVIPDVSFDPLFLDKTQSRRTRVDKISYIGVPIMLNGETIGVLSVDRLFGEAVSFNEDVEFLTILAVLIAQLASINQEVLEREESLRRANRSLKAEISEAYDDFFMIGTSQAMREVQNLITKVADSKASVLLLGESGTGKTLIARIIHEMSPRANHPFVKLNCAAIPENLLESELFGYEKGAFTGADKSKPGRIEEAKGGTLFLDEIGELPLLLQTKLLRFMQEKEFERLGSNRTMEADVRVVTATNRVLAQAVKEGQFREDLYYRLNVFPINVPPLRERVKDIPLLLSHFLSKFSKEYNRELKLSPDAVAALTHYSWPGNVREMENLVERLAILSDGAPIDENDLPLHITLDKPEEHHEQHHDASKLDEIENREVLSALMRNDWIQAKAAKELGLTVRQLGYRIKKFNLEEEIFRGKHPR